MKVSISGRIDRKKPVLILVAEKAKAPLGLEKQPKLLQEAESNGFRGKEGSAVVLHPKSGSPSSLVVLAGLGDGARASAETLRRAASAGLKKLSSLSQKSFSAVLPQALRDPEAESRAVLEGVLLANYRFDKYKSKKADVPGAKEVEIVSFQKDPAPVKRGARLAQILSESAAFARDLVNEPPSNLTPLRFADLAQSVAEKGTAAGVAIQVFDKDKIAELGMGALLGVNRGSAEPPAFIHMHYKPANAKKSVALVGKGITFDSGGLSLKPAESMETMKMDMAGAASILAVFRALPALRPPVEVHGIMALTENMPGGRASKPGDVLTAMNGKTIEVLNTDAEGRLVLADALSYAARQKPDAIIDVATLTGACVIALGSRVAGAMGNSDALFKEIESAALESGESFWRLPLVADYKDGLKSQVADIKNISSVRREAGAIIGGLFLEYFVEGKPWVHLDIAGPAWTDRDVHYLSAGGTGFPARTLLHYLLNQ